MSAYLELITTEAGSLHCGLFPLRLFLNLLKENGDLCSELPSKVSSPITELNSKHGSFCISLQILFPSYFKEMYFLTAFLVSRICFPGLFLLQVTLNIEHFLRFGCWQVVFVLMSKIKMQWWKLSKCWGQTHKPRGKFNQKEMRA